MPDNGAHEAIHERGRRRYEGWCGRGDLQGVPQGLLG